jgi:hypothetical protein
LGYHVLAGLVVVAHGAFILYAVLGALLVLRLPRSVWVHVPTVAWAVGLETLGWTCPLTPLENALRVRAGELGYSGGFIEQYLLPIIYPGGLTPTLQLGLALFVVGVNVGLYALVLGRRRARTR